MTTRAYLRELNTMIESGSYEAYNLDRTLRGRLAAIVQRNRAYMTPTERRHATAEQQTLNEMLYIECNNWLIVCQASQEMLCDTTQNKGEKGQRQMQWIETQPYEN